MAGMDMQLFLDFEQFNNDIDNTLEGITEKEAEAPADGGLPPVRQQYNFPMMWDEDDVDDLIDKTQARFNGLPGKAIIYKVLTQLPLVLFFGGGGNAPLFNSVIRTCSGR